MTNESRRVYRDKTTELICVKRKIQKNSEQHSAIVARSLRSWTLAMLYEPMVNFSAKLYCLAADKIAAQFSLPVCLWQVVALRKRWEIGLWLLWEVDRKSPPGYSETPSSTPRPPFSPNCGSRPLVKTYIANCVQTVPDRPYNGGLYWQPTGTNHCLPNNIISAFRGTSKKHAEHRPCCEVSLPSCVQTFNIHIGLFKLI